MADAQQTVRLHVAGLSDQTSPAELATRFEPFGTVADPVVVRARVNPDGSYDQASQSKGYGYVTLRPRDETQLEFCMQTYNGVRWRGHVLRLSLANEHYVERMAREKLEAEAEAEAELGGKLEGQLALVDFGSLSSGTWVPLADEAVGLRPTRIDWAPIAGDGHRSPASGRWAQGGVESSVGAGASPEHAPAAVMAAAARSAEPAERTTTGVRPASARPQKLHNPVSSRRRQPYLRAVAMYGARRGRVSSVLQGAHSSLAALERLLGLS
ncbi:hypothetical protein T492DRAFT_994672 [Pavlovales sp. CCMP2436]|nr:hypothetical protein T492DRAFT_994672 [Pavlovales sp. CCMP2436]